VISLEEIIMNPILRRWIDNELKTTQRLQRVAVGSAKLHSLMLLNLEDLEVLEHVIELTREKPQAVLRRYSTDSFGKEQSFTTWVNIRYEDANLERGRTRYYSQRYNDLMERASVYFRQGDQESHA
jgi:hypothetical protein